MKALYEFGCFRLDGVRRLLLRDGAPVVLTAKAFDLLQVLVERGGEVVSKDELMEALWPNTVVIEANLTQQIAIVRKALGTTAQDRRYVVTHPGRGYSFAEPVHIVAPGQAPPAAAAPQRWRPRSTLALGLLLAVTAAFGYVWWLRHPQNPNQSRSVLVASPRSVLAILPFQNLSNDAGQEFLSDGLTEETIADLGELSPESLGVIARTSAVTASRCRPRRIAQVLVHGFAWGTLLRIISSLHAAYFSALLVVDVVIIESVLLGDAVRNAEHLGGAVVSLHRLAFGFCFVEFATYVHALVSESIQALEFPVRCMTGMV